MQDQQDTKTLSFEELEHRAKQAQSQAEAAKKRVQSVFAEIANAALDAFSARAMIFYAVTITAGAFGWALYEPTVIRTGTATIFAGILILAGVFREKNDAE